MSFISFHFLLFFPLIFVLYFVAPYRYRCHLLLAASLYFYAVWRPPYVIQILAAVAVSYRAGVRIAAAPDRPAKKRITALAVVTLLANLFVFKYLDFFGQSLGGLFQALSLPYSVPVFDLLLPIGISFYTFQLVSYVVDVYYGRIEAEENPYTFATYLLFFPQLVAGPIERAKDLLPQFHRHHDFDYRQASLGLQLMLWGFFKKLVIADRLAPFVDQVYGNPAGYGGVATAMATLFFACQVYCDFSGYSDIAIGAAQALGYKLTANFNRPYFATSIQDFWKRWHITLSTWLSEYVFTPLSRSKVVRMKWFYQILLSLFLTFAASGLWHGAKWTFVFWGALHGIYLVTSMLTQKLRARAVKAFGLDRAPRLHHALRVGFTFSLVLASYLLFRAESLTGSMQLARNLLTGWSRGPVLFFAGREEEILFAMCGMMVVLGVEVLQTGGSVRERIAARPAWFRWSLYYAQAASVVLFGAFYSNLQQFIYFQF
jgi:hypothetical protein